MKNLLLIILMFSLAACSKDETAQPQPSAHTPSTGQVTFYMGSTKEHWSLLVDGVDKGSLKGATQQPVCGDPAFISLTLQTGSHTIDSKSLDGFAWGNPVKVTFGSGCNTYKVR